MRQFLVLVMSVVISSCVADKGMGGDDDDQQQQPPPDAAPMLGVHELVSSCDVAWAVDGVQPQACEFACQMRPQHPVGTATTCADASRPCYVGPGCVNATGVGAPRACDDTFVAAGGSTGCCVQRVVSTMPDRYMPTFYECPRM